MTEIPSDTLQEFEPAVDGGDPVAEESGTALAEEVAALDHSRNAIYADITLEMDRLVEPVDPDSVTVDLDSPTLVGDVAADSEFYLWQGYAGTCAPTSVAMMLADVLNMPQASNEAVVQRALDADPPLITYDASLPSEEAWSGMTTPQIVALCELYGLDVEVSSGTIEDLTAALAAGKSVQVGVDSHEISDGEDDAEDFGLENNHALVVTGIDEANGVVYLNNPNSEGGEGTTVIPLDQFRDAWADSGNELITTVLPEDLAAGELTATAYEDLRPLDPATGPGEPLLVPADEAATGLQPRSAAGEESLLLPFAFVVQQIDRLS